MDTHGYFFALQCTDEEVEHSYEEFYEDVHTEFLKFGEIVNFKVCYLYHVLHICVYTYICTSKGLAHDNESCLCYNHESSCFVMLGIREVC